MEELKDRDRCKVQYFLHDILYPLCFLFYFYLCFSTFFLRVNVLASLSLSVSFCRLKQIKYSAGTMSFGRCVI
jgi:hypothetical protein